MEENQNQPEPQMTPERVSEQAEVQTEKNSPIGYIVAAIVVIALLIGGVYLLEKQGVLETGLFGSGDGIAPNAVVATVNDTEIKGADLTTSISQITATAQLQGIDISDPNVQDEIQNQAVEMLVNTELLEQAAAERGIEITGEQVQARIDLLIEEIGSEELLEERMTALGIDSETLQSDVQSELMIQALLDEVFAEEGVAVTEEEVVELYENTTGGSDEAPALEDIRPQLEAQIIAIKEQQVVDEYIASLRTDADISVAE